MTSAWFWNFGFSKKKKIVQRPIVNTSINFDILLVYSSSCQPLNQFKSRQKLFQVIQFTFPDQSQTVDVKSEE